MSNVPQFQLVSIPPLSIFLSLPLGASLFLVGFGLICDESIEIGICSKEGNDLTCLILDDHCVR